MCSVTIDVSPGTFEDGLYQMDVYSNCESFEYLNEPLYFYRKTNVDSITTKYKPKLAEKWNTLYDLLENRIRDENLGEKYEVALNNRISIGVLGLGLNEIHADTTTALKCKFVRSILDQPRYVYAIKVLNISSMPIHWKMFYLFCKARATLLLVLMLQAIEYIRRKV